VCLNLQDNKNFGHKIPKLIPQPTEITPNSTSNLMKSFHDKHKVPSTIAQLDQFPRVMQQTRSRPNWSFSSSPRDHLSPTGSLDLPFLSCNRRVNDPMNRSQHSAPFLVNNGIDWQHCWADTRYDTACGNRSSNHWHLRFGKPIAFWRSCETTIVRSRCSACWPQRFRLPSPSSPTGSLGQTQCPPTPRAVGNRTSGDSCARDRAALS
jgi:hypothetical protein